MCFPSFKFHFQSLLSQLPGDSRSIGAGELRKVEALWFPQPGVDGTSSVSEISMYEGVSGTVLFPSCSPSSSPAQGARILPDRQQTLLVSVRGKSK